MAERLLQRPEGTDVEFKRTARALDAATIVAFANSADGGVVLVGVDEVTDGKVQRGEVVGCTVDDEARLQLINKALECEPPIKIRIVVENARRRPFFRVEIPSSPEKPHSTGGGTYKVREDGRNRPLRPEDLLSMLLQREGARFERQFRDAAGGLIDQLSSFEDEVRSSIANMSSTLEWAESNTDDARSVINDVQYAVEQSARDLRQVAKEVDEGRERLVAMLEHHEIVDPVTARIRAELKESFIAELRAKPEIVEAFDKGGTVQFSLSGDSARILSREQARDVMVEAATQVAKEFREKAAGPGAEKEPREAEEEPKEAEEEPKEAGPDGE